MKPTTRLRFVERYVPAPEYGDDTSKKVRILQQWWEVENSTDALHNNLLDGEWRNVSLENEA
jgi:hypothetical protein